MRSPMLRRSTALLVAAVCLESCFLAATAQQASPLLGQGLDPVTREETNTSVPVYLSLIVNRVLSIDEKAYRFDVSLSAIVTWTDPRADSQFRLATLAISEWEMEKEAARLSCEAALKSNSTNATDYCTQAVAATKPPDCTRPCILNLESSQCCDGIWVPTVSFGNVVGFSQDRMVSDEIQYLGNNSVGRITLINGMFSNNFDFQDFPFDTQVLKVPMLVDDTDLFHLVPSYIIRNAPGYLSEVTGATMVSVESEVTGWKTVLVNITCNGNSAAPVPPNESKRTVWREGDPSDPLVSVLAEAAKHEQSQVDDQSGTRGPYASACSLEITVDRLSFYYIWMDIFPGIVITVIAFSVFFTDPSAIDVRLGTVVTLFLAQVAVQFIIVDQLPKTTYLTAFCSVIVASYMILFLIVVEAVVVHYFTNITHFQASKSSGKPTSQGPELWKDSELSLLTGSRIQEEPSEQALQSSSSPRTSEEEGDPKKLPPRSLTKAKPPPIDVLASNRQDLKNQVSGRLEREGTFLSSGYKLHSAVVGAQAKLSEDPATGYRVACYIDLITGPLLFLAYVIAVIVIFVTS